MPNLLIIESPGKRAKLQQILGSGWVVKASMGHVRELASDGEDALGFDMEGTSVTCRYEPRGDRGKKVLSELRQAVKQASVVYLATDPDREGETIAWHIHDALRLKNPLRVVYTEITERAVKDAIARPRSLDQNLVAAGRARDCLDKLVGYRGSKHVVWRLNIGAKSMGRVQSATLHLLCDREREIQAFTPQDYWSVWVAYQEGFKAFYRARLSFSATTTDETADDAADIPQAPESDRVTSQEEADRSVGIARSQPHRVVRVEGKVTQQAPPTPFTTSTLQQAAGAKLHFSPEQTMQVAQLLYEAGRITYMRTDSVNLAESFCASVRSFLEQHDPANVPATVAHHRASKGAQEAHEAIRPTDVTFTPSQARSQLSPEGAALYELIWQRTVASQCQSARLRKTTVVTQAGSTYWEAKGKVVEFPGYTRYWNNLSADTQLPRLIEGQVVTLETARADQKQTQPPPRYTEPKLVQLMERQGIGRPSTYAPTVKTLKEREYVSVVKGKLQPTPLGLQLNTALEKLLPDLIEPDFTAQMEAELDAIARGEREWQGYLTGWNRTYFTPALERARTVLGTVSMSRPAQTPRAVSKKQARTKAAASPPVRKASQPHTPSQQSCPVCGASLERYSYTKDGAAKEMLRCSVAENRRGKCKDVVFFQARGTFWSPKFGEVS